VPVVSDGRRGWDTVVGVWREALARSGSAEVIPDPATPDAVSAAEGRLGITMPAVLREFYSVADGLPVLGGDVYGVRGCAELAWFRDTEAELVEIWDEINRDGGYLTGDLDLLRAGLAVSKAGDEYRLLLVPTQSREAASADEWQLYQQSNDGNGVTPSDSLIEDLLHMVGRYYGVQA
jgi:cell wall assembly regulator SMI1